MTHKAPEQKQRKGVYLVVVDDAPELAVALDYASDFANAEGGYVALLNVMERAHVENWKNVEDRVRRELRERAEQMIWDAAGRVLDHTGKFPMVCIEEGDRSDIIVDTVNEQENIVALVLASSATSSSPGSLVTYFSAKGLSRLSVPVMIVPGHLEPLGES